jgi:hypothetical protein
MEFILPNFYKSSRVLNALVFPSEADVQDPEDIIMFCKKEALDE